jgi:ribose transport system permease protein
VAVALAVGAACGLVNAVLVVFGRIAPFIATLGTLSVFRGAALLYTGGQPILGVPREFRIALAGQSFGIPAPVILAGAVAVVAYVVLRHTRLGEHALALGGNPEAARLSGVNTGLVKGSVYVIAGLLSALAGLVLVARLGAAEPISAQGAELNAIAAAVMGGASLSGGRGSILGTVIGALIIATLTAGLTILNVQAFYQLIAIGTVIILAVLADRAEASRA